jgi:hypothetical protein
MHLRLKETFAMSKVVIIARGCVNAARLSEHPNSAKLLLFRLRPRRCGIGLLLPQVLLGRATGLCPSASLDQMFPAFFSRDSRPSISIINR